MSLHDAYARLTPWELTFQTAERAEALSRAVAEESAGRGTDAEEPHAFITMGAVDAFVRDLEGTDAPAGAIHRFGALAFQGVHFTRAGCPLFLLSTHVARYLVDGAPEGDPVPPTRAGYLQLPQHLFWAGVDTEAPESVDGVFWTVTENDLVHSLVVTGLRPDRPGIGVVPLPEAPLSEAGDWLNARIRERGGDFESDMPGSEMDRLYGFATAGEVLKLLARFFAFASHGEDGLQAHAPEAFDGPSVGATTARGGPSPSRLPFTRVVLDG